MEFWNSAVTEKSWKILTELKKEPIDFIVIGGWAAYLLSNLHKSKDIDIVIVNHSDLMRLKEKYVLKKNAHLRKYEIEFGEIDVDIYVPHYSQLAIPTEELVKYTRVITAFRVVAPEALLILKQGAEFDRQSSIKGGKDRVDIMCILLYADFDFKKYFSIAKKYSLSKYPTRLKEIINSFHDYNMLNLNPRELKLKKQALLKHYAQD